MKRSFFSYFVEAYGNAYPFAPRVRRSLWGLIAFCVLCILIHHTNDEIRVAVSPVPGSAYDTKQLAIYPGAVVFTSGSLLIKDPTIMQRLFFKDIFADCELFTLIGIIIASLFIIRMTPKKKGEDLFRKDISKSLYILGSLIILHTLIILYARIYAAGQVEELTNHTFTIAGSFQLLIYAEAYAGFIVIAMGTWYKRGVKLQQEQDLIV
jgi:hypothetical protein